MSATVITTSPEDLLRDALSAGSGPQLTTALEAARIQSPNTYYEFINSALQDAVRDGCVSITAKLLNEYMADVTLLDPLTVSSNPSIALFELLHEHEWDFDTPGAKDSLHKGKRVIDRLLGDEQLVEWLVEHQARVDGGEEEYEVVARPPMLLETCAALGSVKTFKLLREHGAKVARRSLHLAASEAAAFGVDPEGECVAKDSDGKTEVRNKKRVEMLKYLVDDLGLDVNMLDSDSDRPNHWGTPLNYAAKQREGAIVVKWLLKKGANPDISSAGGWTAEKLAKSFDAVAVLDVLKASG